MEAEIRWHHGPDHSHGRCIECALLRLLDAERFRITELEGERDAWISLDKARLKRITELEAESDYAIRALAEMRTVLEAVDHDDRHLRPLSEHARRKVRAALSKTEGKG